MKIVVKSRVLQVLIICMAIVNMYGHCSVSREMSTSLFFFFKIFFISFLFKINYRINSRAYSSYLMVQRIQKYTLL